MTFKQFLESWDEKGTEATVADVQEAERRLLLRIKQLVKDNYTNPRIRQYLGQVKDFYPRILSTHPDLSDIHVFFSPESHAAAWTNGKAVFVGKYAFANRGSAGSLGKTFIHEVEHLYDQLRSSSRNEFTPRLRQMLREVPDKECPELYSLLGRHAREHADYWVDYFFQSTAYVPTLEEKEFAINALIDRAKMVYSSLLSNKGER